MTDWPLFSVIVMVAWQWLPFATLIPALRYDRFEMRPEVLSLADGRFDPRERSLLGPDVPPTRFGRHAGSHRFQCSQTKTFIF